MTNKRFIAKEEMYAMNTIGIRMVKETRRYRSSNPKDNFVQEIKRSRYLKLCWFCCSPYESYKYNSYACSHTCRQNILYRRKKLLNPLANMEVLTKEKNIKGIKEQYGYL